MYFFKDGPNIYSRIIESKLFLKLQDGSMHFNISGFLIFEISIINTQIFAQTKHILCLHCFIRYT